MIELYSASFVAQLSKAILQILSKRHSVDIPYLMSDVVSGQFNQALQVAIKAFVTTLSNHNILENLDEKASQTFFSPVAEELTNLLDPGLEIFDTGKLIDIQLDYFEKRDQEVDPKFLEDAWFEFQKAFSFASRSLPELREFLRASYEAGSFRVLSDIGGALKKLDYNINSFSRQEGHLNKNISDYMEELSRYKKWAKDKRKAI